MDKIPDSNNSKSESVVRLVASLLLVVGAIALAYAAFHLVGEFFLPVGTFAASALVSWWAVRKLLDREARPISDVIKTSAGNILREAARLTGKALRATAIATKAIREESKR